MRNLIFITFFTKNTIYECSFKELLQPSLDKFGLEYNAQSIEVLGDWYKNTMQKPKIILEAMYNFTDDIVWVDSDAKICKYPKLLFEISDDIDIGVHYLSWQKHYGRPSDKDKYEMVDGTIYVKNTDKMKKIIKLWKQQSTNIGINHQHVLAKMIKKNKDIKMLDIGWENCYINTTPQGNFPAQPLNEEKIVILHTQMSRIAKKKGLKGKRLRQNLVI